MSGRSVENDAPELRVEIVERIGEPTACKVWRGERLIFDGVDKSTLIRVDAAEAPMPNAENDALHPCQRRPHYGDPCECEARLAAVVAHHVVDDPTIGPPFCQECSEAISEYVPWDAAHQARVAPMTHSAENDAGLAARIAEVLSVHRWKSMGVSSAECECGEVCYGSDSLTQFPADEAFCAHLAVEITRVIPPERTES